MSEEWWELMFKQADEFHDKYYEEFDEEEYYTFVGGRD